MHILIIEDQILFREGLKAILTREIPNLKITEASSYSDIQDKDFDGNYDLVLLDIGLPGKNGIEVLKLIKQNNAQLPVLILSMYAEDQYAFRAIRAGAAGYATKDLPPELLVKAIQIVTRGGKYVSSSLAEKLVSQLQNNVNDLPHTLLSDREFDVLLKIASGKTVSEIAELLHLSPKTVSTYRSRILQKMQLKNNAELMYYATKHL